MPLTREEKETILKELTNEYTKQDLERVLDSYMETSTFSEVYSVQYHVSLVGALNIRAPSLYAVQAAMRRTLPNEALTKRANLVRHSVYLDSVQPSDVRAEFKVNVLGDLIE